MNKVTKVLSMYLTIEDFTTIKAYKKIDSEYLENTKCFNCHKRIGFQDFVKISLLLSSKSFNFRRNSIENYLCQECLKKDIEIEFYRRMIDKFLNIRNDKQKVEIEKDLFVIKLMKELDQIQDKNIVKNALILLNMLTINRSSDIYINKGTDSRELSVKNKRKLNSILKTEFLNN